jgi:hypothetical protein
METHRIKYTYEAWMAEAARRFGSDKMAWRFVCPVCGHVVSVADYKAAGAPAGAIAFSCIGRYVEGGKAAFAPKGKGPCNYTGGGLFRLNPVDVSFPDGREMAAFDFAEAPGADVEAAHG